MFNKIITICTGNICRSPAAEFLLRQRLEAVASWQGSVHSAGIGALVNHPADENTQAMMLAKDIDLSAHRAKQLTLEHLRQYHRQAVLDLDPTARGKTFLLGHWINTEIPDPYRRGEEAHAEALRLIELAISPWLEKL